MATFTEDPTNPGIVLAPGGLGVPRAALAPDDIVVPAQAPAPAPGGMARSPAVEAVLAKRDQVMGGLDASRTAAPPAGALPIMQQTTTTTPGIAPSVLNPVLERGTASAERQAGAALRAGEERAQRQEQAAMATTANAYGHQQVAEADRARHAQNAEIARQSELAFAAQKDPEVDPDRFVRNMSTGQSIVTVVLAALNGGFNAAMGKQGNDVMDILSKRIEQDINAQKEQIQSGRIRRGNLISHFQSLGMREQDAAKAAEAMAWAQLDRMTAAEVQRIGAGEHRTEAAALAEGIRAQREQKNDELLLSLGTGRSSTSTVRQALPRGGSPLEQVKLAKAMLELDNAKLDRMGADEVASVVGKQLSPAAAEKLKSTVASVGPGVNETDGAVRFTAQYIESLGGKMDTTTGHITWPDDLAGVGPLDSRPSLKAGPLAPAAKLASATGLVHTDYQRAKDAQDALREYITKTLTGASATPDQQRTFANMVGADLDNEARVRANTENWVNTLFSIRGGQLARLGPAGQKLLEATRSNAAAGAGAPPLVER